MHGLAKAEGIGVRWVSGPSSEPPCGGAVIGLVFGGFISMMRAAEQSGEPLSDAATVAAVLNEVTFSIGCSLLTMVVVIVGRNVKAMEKS